MFDNTKVENLLVDVLNISRERFHTSGIKLEVVDVPDVTVRTKQILIAQVCC